MRLWHYRLLKYLPKLQFEGQLKELVAIMRDLRDKGATNHLLINKVMEYPKGHLYSYWKRYEAEYLNRYGIKPKQSTEFYAWGADVDCYFRPFADTWHNKEYLRVCMANLYEKHIFGVGKSRITDEEWETLCKGYFEITGEPYVI